MSPRFVAAEANETGGQLVARWRGEWFEPRREQLRAVEAATASNRSAVDGAEPHEPVVGTVSPLTS
jgi:hypothetical protein